MLNRPLEPHKNKFYFFIVVFVLTGIVLFNLFKIQIAQGRLYYFDSKNSYTLQSVVRAQRGLIYDRNGVKLVENQPKFNLYIYLDNDNSHKLFIKTVENLSRIFHEDIQKKYADEYERLKNYKNLNEIKLFTKLDYNPYIFQIEANPENFPLVQVEQTNIRKYLYPEIMSHITGYTGEITAEDYETGKYNYGDTIGKAGLERGYDDILRGINGIEKVYYYGAEDKRISSPIQPKINGRDIYLTIDIRYQQKLYDLVKQAKAKKGFEDTTSISSVVEDVKTGEIMAMASYPTYDANLFANGISQEDYNKYLNDPGKPLTNKAIQYAQPSGSIFKTLTDIVALDHGAITPQTIFNAPGTFEYGGVTFRDYGEHNWGDINMERALCVSSNIFHMKTALRLDEVTGGKAADLIAEKFDQLGISRISSLNIGSEAVSYFPTPEDKEAQGKTWVPGFLMNASIGQGEMKLTPLGAANIVSMLANKGVVKKQSIVLTDNKNFDLTNLNIAAKHFDAVNAGMRCAAKGNNPITKYDTKIYPEVSEKTGTAETGQMKNGKEIIHGWEITFTPSTSPEIAMSVFLENGHHGWHGGYISREFYKWWSKEVRS
jgi:penicillin-binding protein 2